MCRRVSSNKPAAGGEAWFHDLLPGAVAAMRGPTPARPGPDFGAAARAAAASLTADAAGRLADQLGLPPEAIAGVPLVGFDPAGRGGPSWTFPEVDGDGSVIGICRRYADGSKKQFPGSRRGLTVPAGWRDKTGPVYVVEGPSDVLAVTHAGLPCVGRPSCTGGAGHLARLLTRPGVFVDIVLVGENDERPGGRWPGKTGAEAVAANLAAALPGRSVKVAMPPAGVKDARAWLTAPGRAGTPWTDRGRAFASLLAAAGREVAHAHSGGPPDPSRVADTGDGGLDAADDPHRLAGLFLDQTRDAVGRATVWYWRGEFHGWAAGAYRPLSEDEVRGRLTGVARDEFVRLAAGGFAPGGRRPVTRKVTTALVANVRNALASLCRLPAGLEPPAWVGGAAGPDPAGLVPVRNGLLDLSAAGAGRLLPPTPDYFTPTALPVAFDPAAPAPAEWLRFLASLWPNDADSIGCLQEWFGYLLGPDTRQQKMLFLVGPPRSGKGTIARTLKGLVGPANFAGPTLSGLTTQFGLAPLLGRSVALIDDARLGHRTDAAAVTERLLTITGEGTITVDRKNRDPVDARLGVRFVMLSNELPRLADAAGAFAGRIILLRLTRTFAGREDLTLTDRLAAELPGILNWAVGGWVRLNARGRFAQPAAGAGLLTQLHELSSPVAEFLKDRCHVGPAERVAVRDLYQAWRRWCEETGRKEPGTEQQFGRDLRAAAPAVDDRRVMQSGERWREYAGVGLRRPGDPAGPHADAGVVELAAVAATTPSPCGNCQPETLGGTGCGGAAETVWPRPPQPNPTPAVVVFGDDDRPEDVR